MSPVLETISRFETIEGRLNEMSGVVGEIRYLPFRPTALLSGWYFCNGDKYATTSEQGVVLAGLPTAFKSDWGIVVASSLINVPNFFDADGLGYFVRAADGETRQVGSAAAQDDAMQNITGVLGKWVPTKSTELPTGVFGINSITGAGGWFTGTSPGGVHNWAAIDIDASRLVRTADENRPKNIGMTPAIYLGV